MNELMNIFTKESKPKDLFNFIVEGGKMVHVYDENDNLLGKGTHWFSSDSGRSVTIYEKNKDQSTVINLQNIESIDDRGYKTRLVKYKDGTEIKIRNLSK